MTHETEMFKSTLLDKLSQVELFDPDEMRVFNYAKRLVEEHEVKAEATPKLFEKTLSLCEKCNYDYQNHCNYVINCLDCSNRTDTRCNCTTIEFGENCPYFIEFTEH